MSTPTPPDQNQNQIETLDPQIPNSPPQSDDPKPQSPPPALMTSLRTTTTTTASNKRRKTYKRKKPTKKIIQLTNTLNPIPFIPPKTLDLDKHQEVLKKVGLDEFSRIEFDPVRVMKTDLIVQLIGNYDPKKRCSYVNDMRIGVNRADLARALKLPPARQDRERAAVEEVDLDSEVFSDEAIEFLEEFVQNWVVVRDEPRVVAGEMVGWARCIRDGHPEKMDVASLIWSRVEKELSLGDKLVDCYYASHLLCLIRSQKPDFFVDEEEKEECMNLETEVEEPAVEEVTITDQHTKDDETMADADLDEQVDFNDVSGDHFLQPCRNSSLVNVEQVEDEHVEEVKVEEHIEEVKVEEVEQEHVEEVKVEEVEDEHVEEVKVEEVEDEHVEEVKVEEVEHEHIEEDKVEEVEHDIEQVDDDDVEDEEEEHEGGEPMDEEGFDMEANNDSFDRDGLTDNFLQGVETSHNPYNSHGMSSMDLFGSYMSHGGKRVMEAEEDIEMQNGIQNSKRIKTEQMWDDKQNDIGFCFDQIQQFMQKAKMIHDSKERGYENMQYSQQIAVDQLQERQQILEMIIKSRDEELAKKHNEVFRLERELYLMSDLVSGYRKALNDTRAKFSEYRKRAQLKEEPLYRDAGPGGLVLSVREIEKQRLKQEEEMMKVQIIAKNFEEECVYRLQMHSNRLSPMFDKLAVIENEVHMLKELSAKAKQAQVEPEPSAELAPSVEPEENQKLVNEDELYVEPEKIQKSMVEDESSVEPEKDLKSMDVDKTLVEAEKNQDAPNEITENDVSMDGVLPDAGEPEEKADGEQD